MIRFQNRLREMRTYEIPIQAGAGLVRQKVEVVRRTLVAAGEGQPTGSLSLKTHKQSFERKLPLSITLAAAGTKGDTSDPLPENLQHVEPFKSAIAARLLSVVPVKETPEPSAAAPPNAITRPEGDSPTDPTKTERPADAGTTTTTKKRGGQ